MGLICIALTVNAREVGRFEEVLLKRPFPTILWGCLG